MAAITTRGARAKTPAHWGSWALVIMLLAAAGLLLPACSRREQRGRGSRPAADIVVTLAPVKVEPLQRTVDIVGTLYGDEEATVSAKVPGRIVAIFKDLGDVATAGEPLAQIEKTDYELAVKQKELAVREQLAKLGLTELPPTSSSPAESVDVTGLPSVVRARLQADNALAKYNRGKQLHEQTPPMLSDQDFANLQTEWQVAQSNYDVEVLAARSALVSAVSRQAELEIARQKLADTAICAPCAEGAGATGEGAVRYAVAGRSVSVGEYVREGTAAFRVIADDPIKFRAAVPERYAGQLQTGQKVRVNVEAYAGQDFEGTIARVSPQVEAATRTFQIEVRVPNEKHPLKGGAFARGAVLTREDANVVFVPLEAVVSFAGTNKVFVVKDGKADEIILELGERKGDFVEVSGLQGDEQVVVTGQNKLSRGVKVTVKSAAELAGEAGPSASRPASRRGADAAKPEDAR